MKSEREQILLSCIRRSHPYGHEINDDTFRNIEGFDAALEAMEEYAQQSQPSGMRWVRASERPFSVELLWNDEFHPGESAISWMGKDEYDKFYKEYKAKEGAVLFTNTRVEYDSCDCGGEYGCSHGSWPITIHFGNNPESCKGDFEDETTLVLYGTKNTVTVHDYTKISIGQFVEICDIVGIVLHIKPEWLSESFPAGAAEGASEGISKIREVMNWISQCVDEDHDLEVSEIKMIWNDLSDAILLIKSTPHSGEGMAEALTPEQVRELYASETGEGWMVTPVCHGEKGFASWDYQSWLERKLASLSSPGSGWVNLVDELPNYGTIDVWVSDEYSKRRIPNSEYRQRDFYNKSDRFEAFMHTDDGMRWVDITNMVTHWRPLPAPPGE